MVLIATQVKRRRGTTAENDAFTGAEGEITVDTETHQLRVHDGTTQGGFVIGSGGSGSGRNIGDIFYTARTDTGLAGAVECNGGTYSTADYEGEGSIGELLAGGNLPYVSLAEYGTLLSTNGVVGVFGWDGTGTTTFRVPTLQDVFVECGQASQLGNYIPAGLPEIVGELSGVAMSRSGDKSGALSNSIFPSSGSGSFTNGGNSNINGVVNIDASLSSSIYGNSNTVQPKAIKYRAMVQLFNGTTSEAVATVGTVVAQVGELRNMSNITATGKETVVGWGMPDFDTSVSVSSLPFTAPYDCYVFICAQRKGNTNYDGFITVNGITVLPFNNVSNYMIGDVTTQFMIKSGDVVNVSGGATLKMGFYCKAKGSL